MHILIAGGSGFLGRALTASLTAAGHQVLILTRGPGRAGDHSPTTYIPWTPDGTVGEWAASCVGMDAVINLAGESIGTRRWSAARKHELDESRQQATRSLVRFIQQASPKPRLLVSSSAIGYYGNRGDDTLTETEGPGHDFLAQLAARWETTASTAANAATRVVLLRTGIVLDPSEGALAKMLPPFRAFAGGPFGSGRQFMSWIHRDDWVSLVAWILDQPDLAGSVNAVAPGTVRNAAFAATLGRVLGRPSVATVPGFVLKLVLGEMAQPLLLSSQRVVPAVATKAGFTFQFPTLEPALRELLTRR